MNPETKTVRTIGIAGYMGAGKSTAASLLAAPDVTVFDADREAKRVMDADPAIGKRLQEEFGRTVMTAGHLDYSELGRRAFESMRNLRRFNAIVHPPIFDRLQALLGQDTGTAGILVLDAALLPLMPATGIDLLLWIEAKPEMRLERLLRKGGLDADALRARMRLQEQLMPSPPQPPWHHIENDGDLAAFSTEVRRMAGIVNDRDAITG